MTQLNIKNSEMFEVSDHTCIKAACFKFLRLMHRHYTVYHAWTCAVKPTNEFLMIYGLSPDLWSECLQHQWDKLSPTEGSQIRQAGRKEVMGEVSGVFS